MNPDPPIACLLHATCLDIAGRGVLIQGPPGSGKSDLALRIIDQPGRGIRSKAAMPASLVADDQVVLTRQAGRLLARPPDKLKGLIEIRGLGIVPIPYLSETVVHLLVSLGRAAEIERMPEAADLTREILGLNLPHINLDPKPASAPARLRAALDTLSVYGPLVISTHPY